MRELFVPGRLCLLGEHSDWAAGYRASHPDIERGHCLVAGTDQGLHGVAEPLTDALEITTRLPSGEEIGPARLSAEPAQLEACARGSDFFSYAAGAALEMGRRHGLGGLRLRVRSELPVRKGLSSSAAVCVLVVRAYAAAYDLPLGPEDEMELAYHGERHTGSACGRMDQICAFGRRVSFLTFDGDALHLEEVAVGAALHLLVVDLRRGKDTRRILADLNACYPDAPGPRAAGVRDALGPRNAALVAAARQAVAAGDAAALGAAMTEAQALFDDRVAPACPELRAPRLHEVLAHPAVAELALGGKGVGSQGDGCAQLVCAGPEQRARLAARLERELDVRCLPLTPGARAVPDPRGPAGAT